jgi:hypothetical protein
MNVLLSEMAQVHFLVAWSPQMTLLGQFFAFAVAVMAPSPKGFITGRYLDIPLFEKINDTLRIFDVEDQNMQ